MAEEEAKPAEREFPFTVKLKRPFEFAGERYAALTFRRGRLGDLKGIKLEVSLPPVEHLLLMTSRMCGVPVAALELVDGDDISAVLEVPGSFFVKCLEGGGTP